MTAAAADCTSDAPSAINKRKLKMKKARIIDGAGVAFCSIVTEK